MGAAWERHGVYELDFGKPQLEHDALLVTSSAYPVCAAHKAKGYDPAVRSTHAFCSLPVKTRELFWPFAVSFMEKHFRLLLLGFVN
jgi:hypothetical protein